MTLDARLELAVRQIEFARRYTLGMLEGLGEDDWFHMPAEGVTHIAWQAGHLAMAEYGLCMFRQRGRRPEDGELMTSAFRKQFSKGSTPLAERAGYPPPEEILETLAGVHTQAMREVAEYSAAELDQPCEAPTAAYETRLGALLFCAEHEMLHAGQIGLLRRLLGKPPLR